MKDIGNLWRHVAPLFKRNPTRDFLADKWRKCTTHDGRRVVEEAMALQRRYPKLSGGELIRLAYWGASGSAPE